MTAELWRKPTKSTPGASRPGGIDFHETDGTYAGTGAGDRHWQISEVFTGWRLEFWDPGDAGATYAGTHTTLEAAQAEAAR